MLTLSQHKTYHYIQDYIRHNGYAPTVAEIAVGIGIKSRGVVHRYIQALADAGMLEITPNKRRNIRLTLDTHPMSLPIIGRIAAGTPIEAITDQQTVNISDALLGPNRFILEVRGDSMIGDNICDKDYIICEKRNTARNGEIVVALIDNQEATLKRLQRNPENNTITLLPSNPTLSPMVYAPDRIQIQGIYLGLLRLGAVH
jgi:repressor LexA